MGFGHFTSILGAERLLSELRKEFMALNRNFYGEMKTRRPDCCRTLVSVWILWLVMLSPELLACRFNVRDVGFVELQAQTYTLQVRIADPSRDTTEIRDRLRRVAQAALVDSNIQFELNAADTPELGDGSFLQARLIHPDGGALALPGLAFHSDYDQHVWRYLESLYSSPHRDRVFDGAIECYGSVILVEGADPEANARARAAVDAALAPVSAAVLENKLEKPIDEPPRGYVIPRDDAPKERVFLWSLGLDADSVEPQISFLYGRGRQIGEPLVGEEITEKSVYTIFSTVGLSCECGLDRSWMQGTAIPMRWDVDTQRFVAATLGFDPESPLIKMEMSQILAKRGPGSGLTPENVAESFGARSPLATYEEHSVDGDDSGNSNEFADLSPEELLAKLKEVTRAIDDNEGLESADEAGVAPSEPVAMRENEPSFPSDRGDESSKVGPESGEPSEAPLRAQRLMVIIGLPAILVLIAGMWIVVRSHSGR